MEHLKHTSAQTTMQHHVQGHTAPAHLLDEDLAQLSRIKQDFITSQMKLRTQQSPANHCTCAVLVQMKGSQSAGLCYNAPA
jgi:hypothetical protein